MQRFFVLTLIVAACSSPTVDKSAADAGLDGGATQDATSSEDLRTRDGAEPSSDANVTLDAGDAGPVEDANGTDMMMTPTCTPTGGGCTVREDCCSGNRCEGGVCEQITNCVRAGDFCTRQNADRCCSGRCDGDSCVDGLGGPCNGRGCLDGSTCIGGTCECGSDTLLCSGRCVNPMYSNAHCGACDNPCGPEQRCLEGTCECIDTFLDECGTECVNTNTSESHCGRCNNRCPADRLCGGGVCQCASPLIECSGVCLDVSDDPGNCGDCDVVCDTDEVCGNRNCVCAPGLTRCPNGACIDLMSDDLNCGMCGLACNGMKTCQMGECRN